MLLIKVSVAIAARGEGIHLNATIGTMLAANRPPDEIVVVDDCTEIPESVVWPNVRMIRNTEPMGSGPSKHKALAACTGDFLIVVDGHCRAATDWLDFLIEETEKHPKAVLCPLSTGIESNSGMKGWGAKLEMGKAGFWEPHWGPAREGPHAAVVQTVVGGCYAFQRSTLEGIGGYTPCYHGYGCEEEFIGIRAWMLGYECRVVPRSNFGHHYGRKINRATSVKGPEEHWQQHYNRHVAAMTCFEDGVYERAYKPLLDKYGMDPAMYALLEKRADKIKETRQFIQSRRRFKDSELEAWCGVKHP